MIELVTSLSLLYPHTHIQKIYISDSVLAELKLSEKLIFMCFSYEFKKRNMWGCFFLLSQTKKRIFFFFFHNVGYVDTVKQGDIINYKLTPINFIAVTSFWVENFWVTYISHNILFFWLSFIPWKIHEILMLFAISCVTEKMMRINVILYFYIRTVLFFICVKVF